MVWCPKAISLWFLTTKTTPNSFPRYNFPLIFLWFNSDFHCKCTPDFSLISHYRKPPFLSKFLLHNERIFLQKTGFLSLHFFLRIFVWFFFAWQSISFYFLLCVLHLFLSFSSIVWCPTIRFPILIWLVFNKLAYYQLSNSSRKEIKGKFTCGERWGIKEVSLFMDLLLQSFWTTCLASKLEVGVLMLDPTVTACSRCMRLDPCIRICHPKG